MRLAVFLSLCGILTAGVADAGTPKRVIAVGGEVTETVYALGAGDMLVGVDQTSYYPRNETSRLPNVGYVRALAAEGLLSLKADLLLTGPEAGPPQILDQVEAAGLPVLKLDGGYNPEATVGRVKKIGEAIGREGAAARLAAELATDLETVRKEVAATKTAPRVLFLLQAGRGTPMAGGGGTAADAMIALAGGVNAISGFHGYKPLSPEAAIAAAPDILMIMSQSVEALGGRDAVLALPEVAATPAARNGRLVAVDGLYTLGFGPRLAHAIQDLAVVFHPEATFAPLPERPWTKGE